MSPYALMRMVVQTTLFSMRLHPDRLLRPFYLMHANPQEQWLVGNAECGIDTITKNLRVLCGE